MNSIEFWIHLLAISGISVFFFRKIKSLNFDEKIFAAVIIVWANLIFSSLILAAFNILADNNAFFICSIIFQICLNYAFYRLRPESYKASGVQWIQMTFDNFPKKIAGLCSLILAFMVGYMAFHLPLGIPDTLSIKLPNAFFYLQKGNFLPATEMADDGRLFSTPIDGTILWTYLIRWHQSTSLILISNFLFWIGSAVAIYRISRTLNASRWASVTAGAFFSLSVCMLFQGSSDNDDLLSSISAIFGVVFLLRWFASWLWFDILLASLGIGISLGAKMFPALYAPAALILFIYFAATNSTKRVVRTTIQLVYSGLICALFLLPVAFANHARFGGYLSSSPLLKSVANSPFRAEVAAHNIITYNIQALISPIFDSTAAKSGADRNEIVKTVNEFFISNFIPRVKDVGAYNDDINVIHPNLYYNTVWYGLLADLILIFFCLCLFKDLKNRRQTLWLCLFFLCWDLFFCSRAKYIEELARYWVLPFALVSPVIALYWDEIKTQSKSFRFVSYLLFSVVWISTFWAGYICLTKDSIRYNFRQTWKHEIFRQDIFNSDLNRVLKSCDNVNVLFHTYGYPIFSLLHEFTGRKITYNSTTQEDQVLLVPGVTNFLRETFYANKYLSIDLANNLETGFKYLDKPYAIPVYAEYDATCANAYADKKSLIIAEVSPRFSEEKSTLPVNITILNRRLKDEYSYAAFSRSKVGVETSLNGWTSSKSFRVDVPKDAEFLDIRVQNLGHIFSASLPVNQAL